MSRKPFDRERGRAPTRPLLAALLTIATVLLALPAGASGHAVLTHTAPHQNAGVDDPPTGVRLDFNEPVEVSFGAVRVFDSEGVRVDSGPVTHPDGEPNSVEVGVRSNLPEGIYTTTYRVVSADGHPVSGGFSFGVGEPVRTGPGRGAPDVAELLARSASDLSVEVAYGFARGLHYAALLLLVGAFAFRLLVWPPGSERRWPGRLVAGGALLGLGAALAGLLLQGALGAGTTLPGAFDDAVLEASLSTKTGEWWLIRACAWFVAAAGLFLFSGRPSRLGLALLALPTAALVASLPIAGHASTQLPQAVLIPADLLHVLAAGTWLGSLVLLLAGFWPRRAGVGDSADPDAIDATTRFSRLALPAIALLVLTGTVEAWFYLGSLGALVETTYGLALLAKIALLGLIVVIAAFNRRRLRRGPDQTGARALRRSMRGEVVLAVLVLVATAVLVRAAPPAAVADGPVLREVDVGPYRLQLDIEPGDAGPNDFHLYLFDRVTGAQVDRVKALRLRLTQPERDIGPITVEIPRKGPAHYELLGEPLGVPGRWEAEVDVRVSKFDQFTTTTEFEVR